MSSFFEDFRQKISRTRFPVHTAVLCRYNPGVSPGCEEQASHGLIKSPVLQPCHCHYDLRKYNFTNRVIPTWNSLPDFVVSAGTINTFKNRLDKFWSDQDILYDYKADLHGIGNRSVVY